MFKPRENQHFYMINSRFQVKETQHTSSKKSKDRIAAGNCFKYQSEATVFAYLVKQLARGNYTGFDRKPWWRFW